MFSSTTYKYNVNDIPSNWILETYMDIPKLEGQKITIKSIYNEMDSNPSMDIFYNYNLKRYTFKCWSTGKSGSAIDIMMSLWGVDYKTACQRIMDDYERYLNKEDIEVEKVVQESYSWVVSNLNTRNWNTFDAKYWSAYNINSAILQDHNVKPIKSYTLNKVSGSNGDVIEKYDFSSSHIYGYFKNDGTLYKVYRPKHKKSKFTCLDNSYIQGEEQLKHHDVLIITASLKDMMALKSLKFKVDMIAPTSESTLLSAEYIKQLKKQYSKIITLLDNDDVGKKMMKTYKNEHGLGICYIPSEKDVSDLIRIKGKREALYQISPRIHQAIN